MKTFVLALSLLAPDGTKTDVPVDLWTFTNMTDCVKSSTYLNDAPRAKSQQYTCIEYDPGQKVAAAKAPKPIQSKRNS